MILTICLSSPFMISRVLHKQKTPLVCRLLKRLGTKVKVNQQSRNILLWGGCFLYTCMSIVPRQPLSYLPIYRMKCINNEEKFNDTGSVNSYKVITDQFWKFKKQSVFYLHVYKIDHNHGCCLLGKKSTVHIFHVL